MSFDCLSVKEPVKTDCWIELIRTDSSSPKNEPAAQPRRIAHRGSPGNLPKLFGIKADNRRTKRTKSFGESFTTLPYVYVRKNDERDPTVRVLDEGLTKELLLSMPEIATGGVSFVGKNALVTGCGCDSIGSEVVKSLLEGGATVICTTSSFSSKSTKFFRSMYENHGARGSKLILLPFQPSQLNFVIPFGAISVVGPTLSDIDFKSKLTHRIMLANTYRRNIDTRPCFATLPLSPNLGTMGGDGLNAEAKLGLEALMNKWHSEGWEHYLSIGGAVIGWTRGTGLMTGNNVSAGIEKLDVRNTFSQVEMAFNLTSILHPRMAAATVKSPLWIDLGGGIAQLHGLKVQVKEHAPYTAEKEMNVALNTLARASYKEKTFGDDSSAKSDVKAVPSSSFSTTAPNVAELKMLETFLQQSGSQLILSAGQGLGIDVEPVATFADFVHPTQLHCKRNFAYCEASASTASSFVGRWATKEAVVKA
ncbi:unnamed protein product [Aphanomyces euteiches]